MHNDSSSETRSASESASGCPQSLNPKTAGIASTVLWALGFALYFVCKPGSMVVWVPDALLLLGFWPLLMVWRFSFTWIIFGILNMFTGFVLQMANLLPPNLFTKEQLVLVQHLNDYHPALIWIIIGFISFVYGVILLGKNLAARFMKKPAADKSASNA